LLFRLQAVCGTASLRYSRVVRTDGFVEFEGLRYFVGFEHVGRAV